MFLKEYFPSMRKSNEKKMGKSSNGNIKNPCTLPVGYGRVPIVMAQSFGERARDWLKFRQQRAMFSKNNGIGNLEDFMESLEITPEYKCHPSPELRLPHHLRSKVIRKVYVPHRSKAYKTSHYSVLKGRPVPVPHEIAYIVKASSLAKHGSRARLRHRRALHPPYDTPRNLPEYLNSHELEISP